jgi:predicted ATPase
VRKRRAPASLGGPFLRRITMSTEEVDRTRYPFSVRAFAGGIDIDLTTNVTFFVGENGSGKSTLLEAIATRCGFDPEGGSRDHRFSVESKVSELGRALALSWLPKVSDGFFMPLFAPDDEEGGDPRKR